MSFAGLIVLFAVVGFFAWKIVKQRSAAFAAAGDGLGFTYQRTGSPFEGTDLSGITLLTGTVQHRYRDVLLPKSAKLPVVVSQFNYLIFRNTLDKGNGAVVSGGSGQQHSILAYRIAHGSLARFRLFTRGVFGNPLLVRALVDQPQRTWLHVQVSPDWLLLYDPAILILKPEAVTPALDRIRPIAEAILGGSAAAA